MINMYGDTAYFSYTPSGDPDIIRMSATVTGEPNFYFTYDKNKRLVEFQGAYVKDLNIDEYRRFYYHGNKIIRDSFFIWTSQDNPYNNAAYGEGKYSYDRYDRIIEYNYMRYQADQEVFKDTIRYNYPDENPYIENRNYWAGNRVLMFVSKHYNRTTPATSYNSFGYPTHFAEYGGPSLLCCTSIQEIVFDCSGSNKAQQPTEQKQ
jgi:hypothetical protein